MSGMGKGLENIGEILTEANHSGNPKEIVNLKGKY